MAHNQNTIIHDGEYKQWIADLKAKVKQTQLKAALAVNQQLLMFYWDMGNQIIEKQKNTAWGAGFLKELSRDLMSEFPDMKGFSERNIKYIRQWVTFWSSEDQFGLQAVAQLTQIPWGHNQVIIAQCQTAEEGVLCKEYN